MKYINIHSQVHISWLPPPPGWIVMNSDGAVKTSEHRAGCRGVLRNDNRTWIAGFAKALGDTTAYMAELWGIYEGLKIAKPTRCNEIGVTNRFSSYSS
ncbi:TMV resistance protein N [Trifolium repens]|nr:TMV resistance protein N [Trifolium repens]